MPHNHDGISIIGTDQDERGQTFAVIMQSGNIIFKFVRRWNAKLRRPGIWCKDRWRYAQRSTADDLRVDDEMFKRLCGRAAQILLANPKQSRRTPDHRQRTLF